MNRDKRSQLEAAGWRVGGVQELLNLSLDEAHLIDIKARLSMMLTQVRNRRKLTQVEVAQRLKSSQSRVAKMEAASASVSLDLLIRSLLTLGVTRKEIGAAIAGK